MDGTTVAQEGHRLYRTYILPAPLPGDARKLSAQGRKTDGCTSRRVDVCTKGQTLWSSGGSVTAGVGGLEIEERGLGSRPRFLT